MSSSRNQKRAAARAQREAREHAAAERAQRVRRIWTLAGVAGAAVVIVAIAIALGGGPGAGSKRPARAQTAGLFSGIPQQGTALGSPRAPVTLEEFADLQCPYCREYALGALPEIVRRYVRTGKLRLEFRPLAILGSDSVRAARVAVAAGSQSRMWDFIHRFYASQRTENSGYVTDQFLRGVGSGVRGLDVERAMQESQSQTSIEPLAAADTRAKALGIDSTPSFFIGRTGRPLHRLEVTSLGFDAFGGPIERELAR